MKVVISRDAAKYLRDERNYIGRFDARAAEATMRQIQDAFKTLAAYPNAGSLALPLEGRRRYVTAPYVIDYSLTDTAILIASIRHGRQNDPSIGIDDDLDFEEPDRR
jgi:plasmid stabilization system protein ParE